MKGLEHRYPSHLDYQDIQNPPVISKAVVPPQVVQSPHLEQLQTTDLSSSVLTLQDSIIEASKRICCSKAAELLACYRRVSVALHTTLASSKFRFLAVRGVLPRNLPGVLNTSVTLLFALAVSSIDKSNVLTIDSC